MLARLLARVRGLPAAPPPGLVLGDIAAQEVDCIVNSVDRSLLPGTGVDRRIRHVAGPALDEALAESPRLQPGQCVATPGFGLPARHVVHVVAPVFDGPGTPPERLSGAYVAALFLAAHVGARTVAVPLLGGGAGGWDTERSCAAALAGLAEAGRRPGSPAATLVVNDREAYLHLVGLLGLPWPDDHFRR